MQSSSTPPLFPRNKTRRAGSPEPSASSSATSGGGAAASESTDYAINRGLEAFLEVNASGAYKRPWHRLERGLRLNRIRRFIEAETTRMHLAPTDVEHLTNLLHRALDRKFLNSKTSVIYNADAEEIQEIKGLVYHRTADGRIVSQIVEKKTNMTVRRKKTDSAQKSETGAAAPAVEPSTN